jgi:hypothetical protein
MAVTNFEQQIVREAPELEARKLGLIDDARALYGKPLLLPGVEAAGLSQGQLEAASLARTGIGAFEPFIQAGSEGITQGQNLTQLGGLGAAGINVAPEFNVAQGTLGRAAGMAENAVMAGIPGQVQGMGTVGQGIQGFGGATGRYDPATTAEFMNPYQEMVTENALREMRRQGDLAAQQNAAQAVRSGAFGGTREGVQRAEQERNLQDLMSQRIFQDRAQNFGQAQSAGMTAFEQERQRQLAAAQGLTQAGGMQSNIGRSAADIFTTAANTTGNIGQGIGSLAANQANIDLNRASTLGGLGSNMAQMGVQQGAMGQALQQGRAADVSLLSGIGGLEQATAQQQLDAIRATQLQETMAPFQKLAFVSDIYKGAPSSQMTLTSSSAPSATPLQSLLGTVGGVAATAAGASRAGLF